MFCLFHNNSVTSFPVCSSKKRGSLPPKPEPPPPDALSVASLEALEETSIDTLESSDQKIDIRNRLHNLAFIFSLPHLVMLSNLQKLIGKLFSVVIFGGLMFWPKILRFSGIRTGKKPSIHPNDYMDNMLQNAKDTMKERGLNHVQLPDQNMGVILYNGQMTGLDNLSRSGDALLEAATDHFLLSFAIEANDVKAKYWWKKQRLK